MQETHLKYVIKFVFDMGKAVKFHRDTLGLQLKFESPGWSSSSPAKQLLHCTRRRKGTRPGNANWGSRFRMSRPSSGT